VSINTRKLRLRGIVAATTLALAAHSAFAAGPQNSSFVDLGTLDADTQFDQFIVKYRDGSEEAVNAAAFSRSLHSASTRANQMVQAARLQRGERGGSGKPLVASHLRRMSLGADVITVSQKLGRQDAVTLMREIAANPNVEFVQVDRIMKHTLTPNDTRYSEQWGFSSTTAGIRANQAWDVATGSGVIVAVLDTGHVSHSDLNNNIVAGYDFISSSTIAGDGNGRDADPSDPGDYSGGQPSSWHGTHVAGTVAALTNNAKGVAGTAFNAKVMPVRVLGRGGGSTSDIADAIIWASGGSVSGVPTLSAADAADVINMSLGGSGSCDTLTQNAINSAVSRGTAVVVAAGNSNANAANFTPASCNNVINVASITSAGARSSFSNYGTSIDVSAPGSAILSTLNSGSTTPGRRVVCVLQRHLDGGPARCRRRGPGAEPPSCPRAADVHPVGSRGPAEVHRVSAAGRLLGRLRRGHHRRQGPGGCGRWQHAAPAAAAADRRHPDQGRRGDRPGRQHRQFAELHDGRAGGRDQPDVHDVGRHG